MTTKRPSHLSIAVKLIARRARRRVEGTAVVEFAYLAPLLLLMLLGTIEVSRAVSIDRRFGLVTSMISDLVSREKSLGTSAATSITTLQGMMSSVQTVMTPYPSTGLNVKIRAVMALKTDTTQGTIKWSYDCSTTTCTASADKAACAAYTLPAGIVTQGSSVIVVESSYTYTPIFTSWTASGENPMTAGTWTDKSTHSPRQSCVDDGSGCTAPASCPNG